MITRTITTTTVNAFCIDTTSKETFTTTITLAGIYKDEKKLVKAIKKAVESDLVRFVYAESVSTNETLYGMDESFFIKNAKVLPPRATNNE